MSTPASADGTHIAAVLFAGGQSRRMGRDKALLPLPDGRLLWQRQLDVLRELEPAELFISGPSRPGFPADAPTVGDAVPGLGPLGGIVAALAAMRSARLLVLAVDLPMMTSAYLRELIHHGGKDTARGVVPQASNGFFEPLAALYPRTALAIAQDRLDRRELSLQPFIRALIANRLVAALPVKTGKAGFFANWNAPEDLPG